MLPKTLKFQSKIESAYARSMRSNIQPQQGTGPYNLGDTITINIPTRQSLCLVSSESYLKFQVNITNVSTDANSFRWDSAGAHGIIQRIRVFHGSNMLQDIDNYNMLAKMLFDIQMPTDAVYGKYNLLCGTRNDLVVKMPTVGTGAGDPAVALTQRGLSVLQVNSGDRVESTAALVAATNGTVTNTYCLSLISLVGVLCSQNYIPLFEMTSSPLRVEIQLVDSISKALNILSVAGGVPTMTISNCEYVGNFIELGDPAVAMIKDSLGGAPLQFVVPDYRNFVWSYTLTNGSTASLAMPIAAKFSSVKAIFICVRDQGTGAVKYFPQSSVSRNILDYQFRIGASVMPPKVPNTLPEMFAELLKATGSISDILQQPSIEKTSYSLVSSVNTAALLDTDTSVSNQTSGSYYIGIDLESYANAPKDSLFTGMNTNNDDIYAIINYGTQAGATCSARFDAFANIDVVVICENQTAYIRF